MLVPLDGSELALQAMPTARVVAERFGAELQTVSVAGADEDAARLRALGAATLGVDAEDDRVFVVVEGDPAEVIARRTEALGSCVVCMSTHGRGRLRRRGRGIGGEIPATTFVRHGCCAWAIGGQPWVVAAPSKLG